MFLVKFLPLNRTKFFKFGKKILIISLELMKKQPETLLAYVIETLLVRWNISFDVTKVAPCRLQSYWSCFDR